MRRNLCEDWAHELRSVADDLEGAAKPEVEAEDIIQRPREAGLLSAANLAPLFFQRGAALTVGSLTAQSLNGPFDALGEGRSDFALGKAGVPFVRGFHATRPCLIELVAESSGFARFVHFPEVGGLEGALVTQALD